jgi:hypothetical protein
VKILTGNDLKTGAVTWWDGGWSLHVEDAVDVGDHADAILATRGRPRAGSIRAYAIDAVKDR